MRLFLSLIAVCVVFASNTALSAALDDCQAHFFNATHPAFASGHEMAASPTFLCKKFGTETFFALSYNGTRKAPDWVAYRLGADKLGANACRTKSRKDWQRYFGFCSVSPITGRESCREKFFPDSELDSGSVGLLLNGSSFAGTGFDRGHQAPGAAFAWHACGWYRTFTMANMSAQRPNLNQKSWADLEEAVRFWAVTKGEVFVITGPIYVALHKKHPWLDAHKSHHPHLEYPGLEMVRNGADIPTGSFKVVVDSASSSAVGFILPNTSEELPWREMAVSISLIEELTKLKFSLPANTLTAQPDLTNWPEPTSGWNVRPCADGTAVITPANTSGNGDACLQ